MTRLALRIAELRIALPRIALPRIAVLRIALPRIAVLLIATAVLAGCPATGTYLDAKTPAAGTAATGFVVRPALGKHGMPFPPLDVTVAYSPTDDLALHLRALLLNLAVELAPRWRFAHTDGTHFAIAPSLVVGMGSRDVGNAGEQDFEAHTTANVQGRLSLLSTIRVTDYADATFAAFGGFSRIARQGDLEGDEWPYAQFGYHYQGLISTAGAAIGIAVQGEKFRVKPTLEYARYLERHDAASDAPPFVPNNIWTLSIAWER